MAKYHLPVFHFSVSWGGTNVGFSEVSGLTQEIQPIEYRDGKMGPTTLPLKRPGLRKANNVMLKRGLLTADNELFLWFNNTGKPNVERRDITITLLNDDSEPVFVWVLSQAWPIKCEGPSLKATGNDIAIEAIELVHEGITFRPA